MPAPFVHPDIVAVRRLLSEVKLSTREVAAKVGVSPSWLSLLQRGNNNDVGANRIGRIRRELERMVKTESKKWRSYERLKAQWSRQHPNATHEELDAAARRIADEIGV